MTLRLLLLLVFAHLAAAAQSTTVPFEYDQSLAYIRVAVNGKKSLRFLVNTGANTSVIDVRAAAALELPVAERDSVIGTVGREAVAILKPVALKIGMLPARLLPLTRRDLGSYLTPTGERLDGVLGTDILAGYTVTIDYVRKQLRFAAPSRAAAAKKPPAEKAIAFSFEDGTPAVAATLYDTLHVALRFNSGVSLPPDPALYINISESLWRILKAADKSLIPARHLSARGVGGAAYLPVVPVARLDLDRFRVLQPNLVVQPDGGLFGRGVVAGFFGNNLLEKYQKVTIDFPARVIRFTPPKSYGAYIYETKTAAGPKPRVARGARR